MSESVAAAASDPKPIATTDDGYLSQEDEVFDGNDIENNEGKVYEAKVGFFCC